MPNTHKSSKLKPILIEKRSYLLMIVGALLFVGNWFFGGSSLLLIGWIPFMVGAIEYFRGFR